MQSITDPKIFDETKLCIGQEEVTRKKDGTEYARIPLTYNDKRLLFPIKTKTMGVKTMETYSGYKRRTMPFVFENPLSQKQEPFVVAFDTIVRVVYRHLLSRGYDEERLSKLGSCFWIGRILYANIVYSVWDSSDNTRYFLSGKEVGVNDISDCTDYDANGAISLDSIFVGESAISIKVGLYEVHLSPAEKRARVVWD